MRLDSRDTFTVRSLPAALSDPVEANQWTGEKRQNGQIRNTQNESKALISDPEMARQASNPSKRAAIHHAYGNNPNQKLGAPLGAKHQ
jgi:hypothetical protein